MSNKKRVLVLGATGMLGYQVYKMLSRELTFDVVGTSREPDVRLQKRMYGRVFPIVDVLDCNVEEQLYDIITTYGEFDYIVNCIGMIKPTIKEYNPASVAAAIKVNAEFPHKLATFLTIHKGRVIHPGTDCVFSGRKMSSYTEFDTPDAADIYGRTKALGECPSIMTIRTSIIGPEIHTKRSLLEWFLGCTDKQVSGFTNHHWNGMTTLQWAKIVHTIILTDCWEAGVRHLYSNPISKADLLKVLKEEFAIVNIKTPEIIPVPAKEDKCMLLGSKYPTYVEQFRIPHIVDQIRDMVMTQYKG